MGDKDRQEVVYVKDTIHTAPHPTHSCDSVLLVVKDSLNKIEVELRSQVEILEKKYHRLKRNESGVE